MLDVNLIRKNPELVRTALQNRNLNPQMVDDFLSSDERWRVLIKNIDGARQELNKLSRERNREAALKVKEQIKKLEAEIKEIEKKRKELLEQFPNIPAPDVPVGKDASQNKVIRAVGKKPAGTPKDYLSLAQELDLIDVERAAKVAGSRFGYLKREAALLEFGLVRLAFEILVKEGFIAVVPPVMIKPDLFQGMGRLSGEQREERYFLEKDSLYLAGSAEHTIGPMHANEVFEEKDLPRRYVGFSTCFRREAGSYGKDTRGILRVHQFDKVEMFSFTRPEDSDREHQFLLEMQEKMMKELKLPYQVVEICTGDLGFTDAKQYDIETWIPSEGRFRETHSCSNTTDFQARGINVKYKSEAKYVHMLNATAFAIGRIIIAILENHQTRTGTVKIPAALAKYTGFKEIKSSSEKSL